MIEQARSDKPLVGKTYSLYGAGCDTAPYYESIRKVADDCLKLWPDAEGLIREIRKAWSHRRSLAHRARNGGGESAVRYVLDTMQRDFSVYTAPLQGHLHSLSLRKRMDRTIAMNEPQYHLAMLEIELVNRIGRARFLETGTKLALLPHCLRDFARQCRSRAGELDYECKGCSRSCTVNMARKVLIRGGVKPYIWMTADLRRFLTRLRDRGDRPGVLGVACVPELVRGMRMVSRLGIPVVGIPLDANRCARWTGTFKDNTVNLRELKNLVSVG